MPKRNVNRNLPGPYHLSARCINKEWFQIPMDKVWEIFCSHLYFGGFSFGVKIHSFVLMSNHYHLIVSTPECNLSEFTKYTNREISRDLNRSGNRINRTFAGRYYPTLIEKDHYFTNTYKYIYQNPLRANLVDRVEDYKYSTLSGLIGKSKLLLPIAEDTILFNGDLSKNLDWLNTLPNEKNCESMRLALRKGVFKLPRDKVSGNQNPLEFDLL